MIVAAPVGDDLRFFLDPLCPFFTMGFWFKQVRCWFSPTNLAQASYSSALSIRMRQESTAVTTSRGVRARTTMPLFWAYGGRSMPVAMIGGVGPQQGGTASSRCMFEPIKRAVGVVMFEERDQLLPRRRPSGRGLMSTYWTSLLGIGALPGRPARGRGRQPFFRCAILPFHHVRRGEDRYFISSSARQVFVLAVDLAVFHHSR